METYLTDILIIGAGGAGLRAALAAKDANPELKVTVMTQGKPKDDSLTANACSDRMAFHVAFNHTPPAGDDAWRKHAEDIYIGGGQVSDPNLAILLAIKAKDAFEYLDKLGVPWVRRPDGKPDQFRTDGSEYPRACYTGPYTARDIHHALLNEARKQNIEFLSEYQLLGFVKPAYNIPNWTVFASDSSNGEIRTILTHSVVLATGGPGALFGSCLYPSGADAVPFLSALLAGARLVNLEFIQFGLVNPKTRLACSGSLMRALPNVLDQDNKALFSSIDIPVRHQSKAVNAGAFTLFAKGASWPISAESDALNVDLDIWRITSRGGTVYLDFCKNPPGLDKRSYISITDLFWTGSKRLEYAPTPIERLEKDNPKVIEWFNERGVDLRNEKVEIRHEAQHFQGGILINENAETGVPGLFACGECAGGQHGANRPGGNSLMDCQVMGAIAGINASRYAARGWQKPLFDESISDRILGIAHAFSAENGLQPDEILASISSTLKTEMGIVRTHDGLLNARKVIDRLSMHGISCPENEMHKGFAALAAIAVSKAMITSAWLRNESRGSHICMESPPTSNSPMPRDKQFDRTWLIASIVDENEIQVDRTAIPELRSRS